MAEALSKQGGSERVRIDVNQEYEVRHWAETFGVSYDRVMEAVRAVGDDPHKVLRYLKYIKLNW